MELLHTIHTFALTQPEKIALNDCGGTAVTYAQLINLSGRVYHYLRKLGIGREDMVNILLPRGVDPFIAMIGVWRAGAAWVMLEEGYPAERVNYIQNDCGCALVLDQAVWQEAMAEEPLEGWETVDDHDAAFAVYTSGSTGNPKGVLHEYGNVDRIASIDLTLTDYALTSPLNFVASVFGCTSVLHDGGTVFVVPWSIVRDPSAVRECFVRHGITQALCAPSIFHLFRDIPSLELIIVASEPAYGIWSDDPKLTVVNFYGMSESAFVIAYKKLDQPNEISPIGRPCPGVVMTLRDEAGNPVPDGAEGELCFENPWVRGYIGLPELSARVFVNGETHTGDLAKRLENGDYVVLGRMDDMVKINGNRVEPAEVETAVQKVTGLTQVMAKGFSEGNAAYVCLYYTDDAEIDPAAVRKKLQEHLPYYMIPSHFIHLDAFPRTQSGKLSRRLLPKPVFEFSDNDYSAPESAAEKALCDSMAAVLNLDRVSAEADFYTLGGSSVTSIELVAHCPLQRLNIGMIYLGRTPRKIAKIWQEAVQASDAAVLREADPAKPAPLTQTQLGIYAECVRHPGEAVYNNPLLLRFPADTDADRLQHAVETAVKAHPGLFAQIVSDENGIPAMVYRSDWTEGTLCEMTDTTEASFAERKSALAAPFNIHEDRLFRLEMIRTERAIYLFMDFHHIVFDGTSAHILFDDIARAWRGETVAPESYTAWDAAADETSLRESDTYKNAKAWYMEQFGDIEAPSLPEGDRHGEQPVYADRTVSLRTPVSSLRKFCTAHGLTENVVTTAAFGVLLSGYTREKKPVFTTVYNGRRDSRVARTVSMFVKTLPLRFNIAGDIAVTDLYAAVKEQLLGDMANDFFSFAELAAATGITGDVMFVWQDEMRAVPRLDGVTTVKEDVPFNAAGAVLTAELMAEGDQLTLHMEYHANRYSDRFIDDFAARYNRVLDQIMRREKLSEIRLVPDEEVPALLQLSRGETLEYDPHETWLDLFRKWVKERPDYVAVVDSEGAYTYAELNTAANAVAAWLIDQGVTENSFVAVRMGRVKEFPAAVTGIHKAGAAYVPVDPEYPEDRIRFMLEDSGARVTLDAETVRNIAAAGKDAPDVCLAKPGNRAYMIYTSGSTGKPKGVVVPHRALRAMLSWHVPMIGENPVNAHHPSFSFDASVNDLFAPLAAGGQVHILPDELRKDPAGIDRYFRQHQITGLTVSTQIGMTMVNLFPDMPIRYMMMGGEKMLPCEKTDIRLINGYGPTEFTVCSSFHEVDQQKDLNIPIGRPVPNTWSLICDPHGRLLPRGMVGELCLAGPQLAEGYWKRPELTEKVFVPCPWLPGEKMYRTGDLARYNENDKLEYLGRIDNQVKLRGFRIELGEIENRASQYEGIGTVSAQVCRDTLVLYYTAGREIDPDSLKAFMAETLTDYMVPSMYIHLEKMPMTPNGKIDRRALPEPVVSAGRAPYAPPRTPAERALCAAFASVLSLDAESFGIHDDFFVLGGSSIGAMKAILLAKIPQLSIADIYRHKTPARIAEALNGAEEEPVSEQQAREVSVPATPGQLSMMDYQFTHAKSVMYNIPALYRIADSVADDRLAAAVNTVLRHHPALCTVFEPDEEDRFVQRCRPDLLAPVVWEDIPPESLHAAIDALITPFTDYSRPLIRVRLLRCGALRYLFMDMHHMISDGFSVGVLRENMLRTLRGEPLPQDYYYTFLLREQKASQSAAYEEAKQYFRNLLGTTDWCNIPKPDFVSWDPAVGEEHIGLSITLDQMHRAEARCKASANVLCLAAGALALQEYSGRRDILLNWINDNRSRSGNETTVGLLFKILPVALHMDEYADAKMLIEEIRRQTDAGFAHSICNYQEIVENALEDSIEINYLPALAGEETPSDEPEILEEVELPDRHNAAGERVGMYIGDLDGVLAVSCGYQKHIYAPGSMHRFLQLFRKHLRGIVLVP